MRIISGKLKSRRFTPPPGFPSRPTTDFAKEGLFNVLNHIFEYEDADVLDLCAGTGNLSFEFISRGANHCTSIDQNFKSCQWIRENAKKLEIQDQMTIHQMDCILFLKKDNKKYDLIIADPPYAMNFHKDIVQNVIQEKRLNPNGLLLIEHGKQTDLSEETNFLYTRKFGNVYFSFFQ